MRLSDAGLRRLKTKAVYPDHRSPPWPNEDAPRDRSNRWLDDTQRSCDRAHRSCHSLHLLPHHLPKPFAHRFAQLYGNLRFRGNADRDREFNGKLGILCRICATASLNEVVLIRPSKWASSEATATSTTRFSRRVRRPTNTHGLSSPSCRLTKRLSDAGLRRRKTKAVYPGHRLPPWLTKDATPRSLQLLKWTPPGMAVRHQCAKLSMCGVSAKALTRRSPI